MHVVYTTPDGYAVVRPEGELVTSTVPAFRQVLADIAGQGDVVIDLSAVLFIDSAGLGALIGGILRTLEGGCSVVVACGRTSLLHILRTSGIDTLVPLASSFDEAATTVRTRDKTSSPFVKDDQRPAPLV